jgi:hypothetical protein
MKKQPQEQAQTEDAVYGLKSIGQALGGVTENTVRGYASRDDKDNPLQLFADHLGIGCLRTVLVAWMKAERVPYKKALATGKGRIRRQRA